MQMRRRSVARPEKGRCRRIQLPEVRMIADLKYSGAGIVHDVSRTTPSRPPTNSVRRGNAGARLTHLTARRSTCHKFGVFPDGLRNGRPGDTQVIPEVIPANSSA